MCYYTLTTTTIDSNGVRHDDSRKCNLHISDRNIARRAMADIMFSWYMRDDVKPVKTIWNDKCNKGTVLLDMTDDADRIIFGPSYQRISVLNYSLEEGEIK